MVKLRKIALMSLLLVSISGIVRAAEENVMVEETSEMSVPVDISIAEPELTSPSASPRPKVSKRTKRHRKNEEAFWIADLKEAGVNVLKVGFVSGLLYGIWYYRNQAISERDHTQKMFAALKQLGDGSNIVVLSDADDKKRETFISDLGAAVRQLQGGVDICILPLKTVKDLLPTSQQGLCSMPTILQRMCIRPEHKG